MPKHQKVVVQYDENMKQFGIYNKKTKKYYVYDTKENCEYVAKKINTINSKSITKKGMRRATYKLLNRVLFNDMARINITSD